MLVKNKAEATELWQGKNYDAALRRYTKALAHCGKFVGDLSETQAAAVKAAELGLCVACFILSTRPSFLFALSFFAVLMFTVLTTTTPISLYLYLVLSRYLCLSVSHLDT